MLNFKITNILTEKNAVVITVGSTSYYYVIGSDRQVNDCFAIDDDFMLTPCAVAASLFKVEV